MNQKTVIIPYKMRNNLITFISGDLMVTLYLYLAGIMADMAQFGLKVVGTLIIGAAGGLAGMAAKDLYPSVKKYFKSLFKKK